MAKKKKVSTELVPTQMKDDIQSLKGIVGRLNDQLEGLVKETFSWVKSHKFLVVLTVATVAFFRYWLEEEETKEEDDF